MKEYSFQEKLDRIYDELWGIRETTSLGTKDFEGLEKLINLIDNVLNR